MKFDKKKSCKCTELTKISKKLGIEGAKYIGSHHFSIGYDVPIYEISTMFALNRLIGYAKFINAEYGNIYYRGECNLHNNLLPRLFRGKKKLASASRSLGRLLKRFITDERMTNEIKLGNDDVVDENKVEGLLQHYGIPTRFIDVVDNHWVALWMGYNQTETIKQLREFVHYKSREYSKFRQNKISDDFCYQYILLLAVPYCENMTVFGIGESYNYTEIDLRKALPSMFLRPHAQHGLVIKSKVHHSVEVDELAAYDMASCVVGIVKIHVAYVEEWLGHGKLLTQENLFPSPAYDYGYDLLLMREDLFEGTDFAITRYV